MKKSIFKIVLVAFFAMLIGCSQEVNICDCMNNAEYANPDGKYYKPCQDKFKEVFGTSSPSTDQMIRYSLNNCCAQYPKECEDYRKAGY
jgi:hypothetical protein